MLRDFLEFDQNGMLLDVHASQTETDWVCVIKRDGEVCSMRIEQLELNIDSISEIHSLTEMTEWHRICDGWLRVKPKDLSPFFWENSKASKPETLWGKIHKFFFC